MSLKFCNFAVSHLVSRISLPNLQATSMLKVNFKKKTKQGGGFFVRGNHFPSISLHSGHFCMTTKYCPNSTDQCKKVNNDCKLIYSSTNQSTETFKTIGAILVIKKYGTIYQAQALGILVGHVHHVPWSIHQLPKCVVHATQTKME